MSLIQTKPKLTLTRPKEPEFETSQRIRPARVKSSAELEEEMMAKIPKFKARPLNKKVLFHSSFLLPDFCSICSRFMCVFFFSFLLPNCCSILDFANCNFASRSKKYTTATRI